MEIKVEGFLQDLVNEIEAVGAFHEVESDVRRAERGDKQTTWDVIAANRIGKVVKQIFPKHFPREDIGKAIQIEKRGTSAELGQFLGTTPYPLFGGNGVYPDIRIQIWSRQSENSKPKSKPYRICIELDHSQRQGQAGGAPGSLKRALGKAAFDCLTEEWDLCLLLFHHQMQTNLRIGKKIEQRILEKHAREFHTRLFVFPK